MTTGDRGGLRTGSLRHRVIVLVLGVLFVVLLAMVILVQALFTVFSDKDVNAVLNARLVAAQQLVNKNTNPRILARKLDTGGVRVSLVLPDGQTFGTLGSNTPAGAASRTVQLSKGDLAGAHLTLAVDEAAVTSAPIRLRRLLELTGLGALVVTGVALLFTVRLALSPLDAMTNLARSIARGGRGRRLWPTKPQTELGRTAAAFDDMLDALEGAEAAANQAQQAATEAAERTRRFVADAAHELRTPIAGVQAVAEAVLQQPPDADPEEVQRLQLLLVRESRRASQLVDDLLDLARIDSGVELHKENLDLQVLAEAQIDRIRLLAPGLTLAVEGPSLPVYADPARVTQILANLLDNAKQATPPDGGITVRLGRAGNFAEVVVIDSGHGVPSADRERIFDRLVRLDRARDRRSGGSGLGLAIARGFARAHGGDLTCEPPVHSPLATHEPPVVSPFGAYEPPVVSASGGYEPPVVSPSGGYQPAVDSTSGAYESPTVGMRAVHESVVDGAPSAYERPTASSPATYQPAADGALPTYQPPTASTPGAYGPPAAGSPGAHVPPAAGSRGAYEPPVVGTPATYQPPTASTPAAHQPPVGSTSGGYRPPTASTPAAHQPPVGSTPGAYQPPTASAPGGYQPPTDSTSGGCEPPTTGSLRAHEPPVVSSPGAVFRLLLPVGDISVAPTERFNPGARVGLAPVDQTRPIWPGAGW